MTYDEMVNFIELQTKMFDRDVINIHTKIFLDFILLLDQSFNLYDRIKHSKNEIDDLKLEIKELDEEETNSDEEETNSDEEETNSDEEETNSDEELNDKLNKKIKHLKQLKKKFELKTSIVMKRYDSIKMIPVKKIVITLNGNYEISMKSIKLD